jgi:DNA primase small subunit
VEVIKILIPTTVRKQFLILDSILLEHYTKNSQLIVTPDHIDGREFGFTFFDGSFRRHISFKTFQEYMSYVLKHHPKDVYFSIAIYQNPSISMSKKGWLYAELPFDLDAEQVLKSDDELIKAGWISASVYELIKQEFLKLIENFIESDFGLHQKDYTLSFSGGRGYHLRIKNETFSSLDQRVRRQIVEYVSIGYRPKWLNMTPTLISPFRHDYGWCKKLFDYIKTINLKELSSYPPNDLKAAAKVVAACKKITKPSEFRIRLDEKPMADKLIDDAISRVTVAIDERVTVDVNRLLRAPGTVHGGAGLLCKPLTKSELNNFDPMQDSTMRLNSRHKVEIQKIPFEVSMNGETVSPLDKGKIIEINSSLAYYLVVRRGGVFVE